MKLSCSYTISIPLFCLFTLAPWQILLTQQLTSWGKNFTISWVATIFLKYRSLLQESFEGEWVKGGESSPSLGSVSTIPKTKHGLPVD
jgi:hypothetical protein